MKMGRVLQEQDEEAVFLSSYQCAYYVQSPCTVYSQANKSITNIDESSPTLLALEYVYPSHTQDQEENFVIDPVDDDIPLKEQVPNEDDIDQRFILSTGYSSTHGKALSHRDDDYYKDDEYGGNDKKIGCWKYFSFHTSSSCCWIALQLSWRLMVSLGAALLVFFLATKPPQPNMSLQMARISEFGLREGVDESGVATKILTCNCSMDVNADNKSKFFRLHILPSTIQMSYGPLIFATSQGPEIYANIYGSTTFQVSVGTKKKPMYGAGRDMQDILQSRKGLPLRIHFKLESNFRVVWNLIKVKFHHHGECLLVLHRAYDNRHHTQIYDSSCRITTFSS